MAAPRFTLNLSRVGILASAEQRPEGFVVLKGSQAVADDTGHKLSTGYRKLRQALIADGTLRPAPRAAPLVFTQDFVFTSPSAAASVIAGRQTDGSAAWRSDNGDAAPRARQPVFNDLRRRSLARRLQGLAKELEQINDALARQFAADLAGLADKAMDGVQPPKKRKGGGRAKQANR